MVTQMDVSCLVGLVRGAGWLKVAERWEGFIIFLNECKFSDGSVCVKRMDRTCCMSCMGKGLTWGCLWASGLGPNLGLKWAISPIGKKKKTKNNIHIKKTINKTKNIMINNNLKI